MSISFLFPFFFLSFYSNSSRLCSSSHNMCILPICFNGGLMFFYITCNNTLNQCHACKDTWLSDFLLTHLATSTKLQSVAFSNWVGIWRWSLNHPPLLVVPSNISTKQLERAQDTDSDLDWAWWHSGAEYFCFWIYDLFLLNNPRYAQNQPVSDHYTIGNK